MKIVNTIINNIKGIINNKNKIMSLILAFSISLSILPAQTIFADDANNTCLHENCIEKIETDEEGETYHTKECNDCFETLIAHMVTEKCAYCKANLSSSGEVVKPAVAECNHEGAKAERINTADQYNRCFNCTTIWLVGENYYNGVTDRNTVKSPNEAKLSKQTIYVEVEEKDRIKGEVKQEQEVNNEPKQETEQVKEEEKEVDAKTYYNQLIEVENQKLNSKYSNQKDGWYSNNSEKKDCKHLHGIQETQQNEDEEDVPVYDLCGECKAVKAAHFQNFSKEHTHEYIDKMFSFKEYSHVKQCNICGSIDESFICKDKETCEFCKNHIVLEVCEHTFNEFLIGHSEEYKHLKICSKCKKQEEMNKATIEETDEFCNRYFSEEFVDFKAELEKKYPEEVVVSKAMLDLYEKDKENENLDKGFDIKEPDDRVLAALTTTLVLTDEQKEIVYKAGKSYQDAYDEITTLGSYKTMVELLTTAVGVFVPQVSVMDDLAYSLIASTYYYQYISQYDEIFTDLDKANVASGVFSVSIADNILDSEYLSIFGDTELGDLFEDTLISMGKTILKKYIKPFIEEIIN